MNHLSGMDAMFLHIESPEMPMHIGSLNVLDLPPGYTGDFYEDAKKMMSERLHLAAVFTRKLELMPFDLADPVWVEDEDIDVLELPFTQALEMIKTGEIRDGKTVLLLNYLQSSHLMD